MDLIFNPQTIYWAVPFLLFAGALAGLLAGLLGVGGGIITVPALLTFFVLTGTTPALAMPIATATSLAIIVATSLVSWSAHKKTGLIDQTLLWRWAPFASLGAAIGAVVAGIMHVSGLKIAFGVVTLFLSAYFLLVPQSAKIAEQLPKRNAQRGSLFLIGGLSALLGFGGGTLITPYMLIFGRQIKSAIALASAMGIAISLPGSIVLILLGLGVAGRPEFCFGYVYLPAFILITPVSMLAATYGANLAHRLHGVWLRRIFGLFLGLVALRMIWAALL